MNIFTISKPSNILKKRKLHPTFGLFLTISFIIFDNDTGLWLWTAAIHVDIILKVSQFQNELMMPSFLPKYEQKIVMISALCSEGRNLDSFYAYFGRNEDFIHSEIDWPLEHNAIEWNNIWRSWHFNTK